MPGPTRYRDLQAPTLIDVGARSASTGASQVANDLAGAFASFSRTASDVGAELSANLGAERGTREGLAGKPQVRKGFRATTAFGRAYNSAAEAGYSAKVQVDIDETIRRFEDEHEADPDGFDAKVAEYGRGLIAESPPELQDRVALVLKSRGAASAQRIRNQAVAKERMQIQADYITSMPSRVSNTIAMMETLDGPEADAALTESISDNEAQLAALVNDNVLSPMEAAKYAAEYRGAIDDGLGAMRISGVVESMVNAMKSSVVAGDRMLAALDSTALSEGDKEEVRKAYKAARENLSFERSRTHVGESGELARSIAAEGHGPELEDENARLYDVGAISVDEYESNISSMTRNAKAGEQKGIDIEAVQIAMNGGTGLDPTIKEHRDAADVYLKSVVAANGITVGDERYQALVSEMVRKTNILPASADSWARVSVLSGKPDQVSLGAGFLGRVQEANPRAWNYADDPRIGAMVDQVNTFMRAGIVTEKAFEMAHKNVYERTDTERQILQDRYREEIKNDDNLSALQSDLDGDDDFDVSNWPTGAPPVLVPMQAEHDALVSQFYQLNNGDLEAARRMASASVRAIYGYTTVNGEPELMKYAPEKMHRVTSDVIRQNLEDVLRSVGYAGDPSKVRLVPGPETGRTQGREFRLEALDEYGVPDVVLTPNNEPALYEIPHTREAYDAARAAVTARKLAEATAEHERVQQRALESQDTQRRIFEEYNRPEYRE